MLFLPFTFFYVDPVNMSMMQSKPDLSGSCTSPDIKTDGIPVLEALAVVTRALYNCRVFWYHGGIQKLMVLMKGIIFTLIFLQSSQMMT